MVGTFVLRTASGAAWATGAFSLNLRFPLEKTVPVLRLLEGKMRNAETMHILIFLIMFLFIGYALFQGWLDAVGWLPVFHACSMSTP